VYASSSTLGSMRYDGNAVVDEPRESFGVDKVDNSFFLLFLSPRCCYLIQCVKGTLLPQTGLQLGRKKFGVGILSSGTSLYSRSTFILQQGPAPPAQEVLFCNYHRLFYIACSLDWHLYYFIKISLYPS
jgi:hypothetical protein